MALPCILLTSVPAYAVNVDFDGTVSTQCSISLSTNGTLALSSDGTVLGSEESGGIAGAVLILSIGANTVDVDAPSRISSDPSGYNPSGETLEVKYVGAGGLIGINQDYTSLATDFPVANIPLSLLTIHNRLTNSNGFAAGTYTTRTVVTCS